MRHLLIRSAAAAAVVFGCAGVVSAHPGHAGDHFGEGFQHPLLGLDHLLAMVAVGLLAARSGGKALWALPLAFLTAMTTGGLLANSGVLAASGIGSGAIEYGIMGSVLILGTLLAATKVVRLSTGMGLVALFAAFHGYAHAAEMAGGSFVSYAGGFLASTALLHIAGIAVGVILAKASGTKHGWRFAGAVVSACGLLMLLGVV